ncbi:MAG: HEAT repeat domain-containing protein [Deltaproteobacteria bacterium]|nr:HEAT repeat domain-containing protein [Deltaproteobacteria bacterium]
MRLLLVAWGASILLLSPVAHGAEPSSVDKARIARTIATGSRAEVERSISQIKQMGAPRDLLRQVALLLQEGDPRARKNAAYVFSTGAYPSVKAQLIEALSDEDEVVREHCATALGRVRAPEAVSALGRLTSDRSPVVRREAAKALGHIGSKAAVPKIVPMLQDSSPDARIAAILALGALRDKSAEKNLLPLLQDPSETTRLAAAKSLCALDNAEGRKQVEALLGSPEPAERRDGIKLVEDVKHPWIRDAMLGLTGDNDLNVAIAAARGLALQGDARGVEWLVRSSQRVAPQSVLKIETVLEDLQLSSADRKAILARKPSPGLVLPPLEQER